MAIKVSNHRISRSMGKSNEWKGIGFTEKQAEELNEIGYTGRLNGKKLSVSEYLQSLNTEKKRFEVETVASNGFEFTDTLQITIVTL